MNTDETRQATDLVKKKLFSVTFTAQYFDLYIVNMIYSKDMKN